MGSGLGVGPSCCGCTGPPCPSQVCVTVFDCCGVYSIGATVTLKDGGGTTVGTCTTSNPGCCISVPSAGSYTITAAKGGLSSTISVTLTCDNASYTICLGRTVPATLTLTDPLGNAIVCTLDGGASTDCSSHSWTGSHTYDNIHQACGDCLSGCNPFDPYAVGSVSITYTIRCQAPGGTIDPRPFLYVALCTTACNCPSVTGTAGNPNAFGATNGVPYGVTIGNWTDCSTYMATISATFQDCSSPFGGTVAADSCDRCGGFSGSYQPGTLFTNIFGCGPTSWTTSE